MRRHTATPQQGSSIIMLNGALYKITLEKLAMKIPEEEDTKVEEANVEETKVEEIAPKEEVKEEQEDSVETEPHETATSKLEKGPVVVGADGRKIYTYYKTNTRRLKSGEIKQTRTEIRRVYNPKKTSVPKTESQTSRESQPTNA